MKVIPPVDITDALLVGSTVPELDATATGDGLGATIWAPGTTYAAGARVVRLQTHRVYESVDNGNLGNVPENTLGTTPAKWPRNNGTKTCFWHGTSVRAASKEVDLVPIGWRRQMVHIGA